jgi:regulatory protein
MSPSPSKASRKPNRGGAPRGPGHGDVSRRGSFAERREQRAAVDDPAVVLEAALRFLEARPRSAAEVRRRLTTAGYRRELVETAISRLLELHVLDDQAFAAAWVESRDRAHPRGEIALRRELAQKGVDREVADGVLGERRADAGEEAELDRGRRLLERQARTLAREPDARRRRARAYALLARNGFDPETASRLSRDLAAAGTDEPAAETESEAPE